MQVASRRRVCGWVGGVVNSNNRVKPNSVEDVLRLSWGCDNMGIFLYLLVPVSRYPTGDLNTYPSGISRSYLGTTEKGKKDKFN